MDVADRLASAGAGIEDDAVAVVGNALGDGHLMRMGNEVGQQVCFSSGEFGQIRVMRARDHKYVNRCLRVDIAERQCSLISRDDGRGYLCGSYAAEQAVGHGLILTCGMSPAPLSYMVAVLRSHGHHPSGATASPVSGFRRSGMSHARALVRRHGVGVGGSTDVEASGSDEQTSPIPVMTAGEPSDAATRPMHVTETLVAGVALGGVSAEAEADRAVTELYSLHYRSLVRLAALLVRDIPTAEEVVQDSFVAMHSGWRRLRDSEKALSYLRQSVVNRSRSVLRHRAVVDRNAPAPAPDMPSAEHGAIALFERSAVIAALRTLPARQREALVLRFYADMSEAQIADAMQISRGAVKSHTARAMQALRTVLEREV
jgi:RNA polymerase sigma-70 factor (sigma-E family)